MTPPTVLLEGAELAPGLSVEIFGDTYRHFFRARRWAAGERLRITDGRGAARFGRVDRVDRETATVVLDDAAPDGEASLRLTLAAAVIRPERASWIVEKGTEVGVDGFVWFNSERAPRQLRANAQERLRRVARAALEQCGRSRWPEIETATWADLLSAVSERPAVLLDVAPGPVPKSPLEVAASCAEHLRRAPAPLLLLGPEGGFSTTERQQLIDAGARPLWLGPRVLRAETAAVVGAGLLLASGNN